MKKILNPKVFLATLIIFVLSLYPQLSYLSQQKSYAGYMTNAKLTIGDSRASITTNYSFNFTVANSTAIKQMNIKFCTQTGLFTDTCTPPTGFSASTATIGVDNITGSGRTNTPGANTFQTVVTTPSTQSPTAVTYTLNGVTNPSTTNTTFYARVITYSDTGTTEIDHVQLAFAILTTTSMAVTAEVSPNLTFSIAAATSGTVNSQAINVTTGTSASTIPLGILSSGSTKVAAHDLTVTTNAGSGYTITASASATPPLVNGANSIAAFTGTNAAPSTWSSPAGSSPNVNTGFFGYTTECATLGTGTATRFTSSGGNKWAGTTTTGTEVVYSNAAVSSQTTRVGWQAEVNALQPAGSYAGSVILIATPTY